MPNSYNSAMDNIIHQVGCILAYDQACMDGEEASGFEDSEDPSFDNDDNELATSSCCGVQLKPIAVDWFDAMLNYALVMANAAAVLYLMRSINYARKTGNECNDSQRQQHPCPAIPSDFAACLCFSFVVAFQIALCLALRCTGVSIVWCATLAWLMILLSGVNDGTSEQNNGQSAETSPLVTTTCDNPARQFQIMSPATNDNSTIDIVSCAGAVMGIDAITLLYYVVVADEITFVAHGCAIILGFALWGLALRTRGVSHR